MISRNWPSMQTPRRPPNYNHARGLHHGNGFVFQKSRFAMERRQKRHSLAAIPFSAGIANCRVNDHNARWRNMETWANTSPKRNEGRLIFPRLRFRLGRGSAKSQSLPFTRRPSSEGVGRRTPLWAPEVQSGGSSGPAGSAVEAAHNQHRSLESEGENGTLEPT